MSGADNPRGSRLRARRISNYGGPLAAAAISIALAVSLPRVLDLFDLLQVTLYVVLAIVALSQGFIAGYGGIFCFGQSAFFGLGAYAYAVAAINIGESTAPLLLAIIVPTVTAAGLGYFMFYGRISDVYVGAITLTVALILFNVINSSAGPEYHIGAAQLGGFNGIPNIPPLNVPFRPDRILDPEAMFYVSAGLLLAVYFGLRGLLATRFGRVVVLIRENERRAELLGYDVRLHKLIAFAIGGAIAGLAGCLFATWGSFVSPTIFGLFQSAEIIIWVLVGGLGTLLGPMLGAVSLSWLTAMLGKQHSIGANIVFGAVLVVFVLAIPKGILPLIQRAGRAAAVRLMGRSPGQGPNVASPEASDGRR